MLLDNGKVLVKLELYTEYADHWYLFDPAVPPGGLWLKVPDPKYLGPDAGTPIVVLRGPGCDPHCGKALVAGAMYDRPAALGQFPLASELFDPVTNTWSDTGDLKDAWFQETAVMVGLHSGKVLIRNQSDGIARSARGSTTVRA